MEQREEEWNFAHAVLVEVAHALDTCRAELLAELPELPDGEGPRERVKQVAEALERQAQRLRRAADRLET
jgi:HAMP domain-containing protein